MRNKTSTWIFFFLFVLTASGVFAAMVENSRQGLPAVSVTSHPAFSLESSEQRQGLSRVLLELVSGGAFASKDPIGFNGGNNLYRYADNNPVLFVDPFGLLTEAECEALKYEIANQRIVATTLEVMFKLWKPGQTWRTYGLEPISTASGGRTEAFYRLPAIVQKIANEKVYTIPMNLTIAGLFASNDFLMGWTAALALGRPFIDSHWLTHIRIELIHTALLIRYLEQEYDAECKEGCEK